MLMALVGTDKGKLSQAVGDLAKKSQTSDWGLSIIAVLLLFLAAAIQHSSGYCLPGILPSLRLRLMTTINTPACNLALLTHQLAPPSRLRINAGSPKSCRVRMPSCTTWKSTGGTRAALETPPHPPQLP